MHAEQAEALLRDVERKGRLNGGAHGHERPRRYRPLLAHEMPPPSRPKLINKLMAESSLVLVYGDWGSGKSFLTVDIACHVAANLPWRGRPVAGGAAVYVAAEAGRSIGRRVLAWCRWHGLASLPLGVVDAAPDLLTGDGLDELLAELVAFAKRVSAPLRMVVVDTLHAAAPGCEETARDFGRILASARRIVGDTGAAVVLVHHSGKSAERGARGSNSLEAGVDLVFEVREETSCRAVLVRKLRDGEPPELEPFAIETMTLGEEDGEPITAGVAIAVEPRPISPNDPRREEARKRRAQGESIRTIAKAMGVGNATVHRWLQ